MTERQLQFRVGLFVLIALAGAGAMVFQFGNLRALWEPRYTLAVHFDSAPGVHVGTPVRRTGISIGKVSEVVFDEKQGGVVVLVDIKKKHQLRVDAEPRLSRSLLGDSSIDFVPGRSKQFLVPGSLLHGTPPTDPMKMVQRMEQAVTVSLQSFNETSEEWRKVGANVNALMETNRGNLNVVLEEAADSLHQFTLTMQKAQKTLESANDVVGDRQNQENLRKALAGLPNLVDDTRQTITAIRSAVGTADENLQNLKGMTGPLASKSTSIVTRLDATLANLESLSSEMNDFAQLVNKEDGSMQKFATDPQLYRNLNDSAASLSLLLKNLDPILRDARIFSDKIARHPELIGVGGALKGSSGLKDPVDEGPLPRPVPQSPRSAGGALPYQRK